jgi:rhodanese-related sulfurtransferase
MNQLLEFITHHWDLWISLGILLILLFIYEIRSQRAQAAKVSPQDAVILINNQEAVIVDIRDLEQFNKGHIIHSIHVNKEDYHAKKLTKYQEKPLILVCQKGEISQSVAAQWLQAGYTQLRVLSGGIEAWRDAGFPLINT